MYRMYVHVCTCTCNVIFSYWWPVGERERERDRETEREGVREEHIHSTIPQHFFFLDYYHMVTVS